MAGQQWILFYGLLSFQKLNMIRERLRLKNNRLFKGHVDRCLADNGRMRRSVFTSYDKIMLKINAVILLLAHGLFRKSGVFYVMPKIDNHPMAELLGANI